MMSVLILASSSPRRAQLLSQVGLDYQVMSPNVDESVHENESPVDYVTRMSRQKAAFVAALVENKTGSLGFASGQAAQSETKTLDSSVMLAADTVVIIDGDILGKPRDESDAINMLQRLSGTSHQVVTSVTVQTRNRLETVQVETNVQFRKLSHEECVRYWLTGEPKDKAGAYGIQGIAAIFVERLSGSYSNVVGLPLNETIALLKEFGLECLPKIKN